MNRKEILQAITAILVDNENLKKGDACHETTNFHNDLVMGSLDKIDFILTVEDMFRVRIPDKDVDQINTVGDMTTFIQNRKT